MTTDKSRADALTDLLPCPFCGGNDLEIANTHTPSFWVRCNECDAEATGEHFPTPTGTVRENRFHYSPTPDDTGFEATFENLHPEYQEAFRSAVNAWNRRTPVEQPAAAPIHSDDACVDQFAASLKSKLALARAKGRGGWESCDPADLSRMLREHVEKGDPRDVANFCMFLWALGKPISAAALPAEKQPAPSPADERAAFEHNVPLHELWADAAALCHRVQQGSLPPDALAAHIRKKIDAGIGQARASSANETGAEGIAHEVWAAAQLAPGEGIEDGTRRVAAILSRAPAQAAEPMAIYQILTEEGAWLDTTPEYYARVKSDPALARVVYSAPQPAQADARIDVEALLRACVPGGDICDPQRIADSIREWFDDHGAQADARVGMTAELREILQACVDVMLHRGVPTDNDHPERVALDRAQAILQGGGHADSHA